MTKGEGCPLSSQKSGFSSWQDREENLPGRSQYTARLLLEGRSSKKNGPKPVRAL